MSDIKIRIEVLKGLVSNIVTNCLCEIQVIDWDEDEHNDDGVDFSLRDPDEIIDKPFLVEPISEKKDYTCIIGTIEFLPNAQGAVIHKIKGIQHFDSEENALDHGELMAKSYGFDFVVPLSYKNEIEFKCEIPTGI